MRGDLEEKLYTKQPLGFISQRELSTMVCRVHKSPQALLVKFRTIVQQFGMIST